MLSPRSRAYRALAVAALTVASASCAPGTKLSPVRGKVFHGDAPAAGATVVFHPKGAPAGAPTPSGAVGDDGTFALRTHPHGDGAPPGEYTVLVTWYPPDARSQENPKNKLPAKFADPAQSPLTATVGNGATELEPFRIPLK